MNEIIYKKASHIIKELYGEDAEFREGQYEAIEATLLHNRTLVVQKTGWGKSLVYFVCTKILRNSKKGVTFVVSPLLALMENQMETAVKLGLKCEILNSKTKDRHKEIISNTINNIIDIVFITPETLFSDSVQNAINYINIGLFVIDEAHCISDWGHDFRLEYTRLNKVINQIPSNVPVLGTTATANNRVIADLKQQFGNDVYVSKGNLMRETLSIQILKLSDRAQRYAWILENLPKLPGSGIVYCLTKKDCDYLANFLLKNGINARSYHSDLPDDEVNETEILFKENKIKVIIATVKLGMGYDKGDIAFVIHYQQPSNIIAYYQQIGRAGRNIDRAYTFLMCGEEDTEIQNYFIDTAFPTERESKIVYNLIYECSEKGITRSEIMDKADIKPNRLDKALMFLINQDIITKEKKYKSSAFRYYPTLNKFKYNKEHYDNITEIRYQEQKQMKDFINTDMCLNRFLVNKLDDNTTKSCGVCQNCLGYKEYLQKPNKEYIDKALNYIDHLILDIEPRKNWPNKNYTGNIKIEFKNETGICLSKYGDPGYGTMVKRGKYNSPKGFCDELVEKSYEVLNQIVIEKDIKAITCVPSKRSNLVDDFTKRLAKRCGLTFINTLQKNATTQQKDMNNSNYQCKNAFSTFSILDNVDVSYKNIILVDDIVDSKWTLTVCGYLLGKAGFEKVIPFALADSSENNGES